MPSPDFHLYASDQQWLAVAGAELAGQDANSEVGLSQAVADAAVAAWQRDHPGALVTHEGVIDRSARNAAAELALIGLTIEQDGRRQPDGTVRVRLHPDAVAAALSAAKSGAG